MQLFNIGQLVATPGALKVLEGAQINLLLLVGRHICGDYGDLGIEDVQANAHAIKHGLRILSAYNVLDERLYVITEADRSATTILLTSEY